MAVPSVNEAAVFTATATLQTALTTALADTATAPSLRNWFNSLQAIMNSQAMILAQAQLEDTRV